MRLLTSFFTIIFFIFSCNPKKNKSESNAETSANVSNFKFDLTNPNATYTLPNRLKEISGLSYYKGNEMMCVNDEKGKIFTYDIVKNEITNTLDFGKDGDYEGFEIVNSVAYILRSDGKIKALNLENNAEENIDCTLPEVFEYEGLGFDYKSNCLLLVTKEMSKKSDNNVVYSYNIGSKSFSKRFEIPQNLIEKNAFGREFKPSGIAVHPISSQIYIIASAGKKLIILSETGDIISQYSLDGLLFRQPEGICFSPNGQLYVSSEGVKGEGYILKFDPK
jgi:WD40 repeat protein